MREIAELYPWFTTQTAATKDTLEYYKSPNTQHLPDAEDYIDMCTERVNYLELLCEVFNFYQQFMDEGLFGDIDLDTLKDLKFYCGEEKARLTDKVYENIKDKEKFYSVDVDSDAMNYWQDAELYLIRLISVIEGE